MDYHNYNRRLLCGKRPVIWGVLLLLNLFTSGHVTAAQTPDSPAVVTDITDSGVTLSPSVDVTAHSPSTPVAISEESVVQLNATNSSKLHKLENTTTLPDIPSSKNSTAVNVTQEPPKSEELISNKSTVAGVTTAPISEQTLDLKTTRSAVVESTESKTAEGSGISSTPASVVEIHANSSTLSTSQSTHNNISTLNPTTDSSFIGGVPSGTTEVNRDLEVSSTRSGNSQGTLNVTSQSAEPSNVTVTSPPTVSVTSPNTTLWSHAMPSSNISESDHTSGSTSSTLQLPTIIMANDTVTTGNVTTGSSTMTSLVTKLSSDVLGNVTDSDVTQPTHTGVTGVTEVTDTGVTYAKVSEVTDPEVTTVTKLLSSVLSSLSTSPSTETVTTQSSTFQTSPPSTIPTTSTTTTAEEETTTQLTTPSTTISALNTTSETVQTSFKTSAVTNSTQTSQGGEVSSGWVTTPGDVTSEWVTTEGNVTSVPPGGGGSSDTVWAAIIGVSAGVILVLLLIAIVCTVRRKKLEREKRKRYLRDDENVLDYAYHPRRPANGTTTEGPAKNGLDLRHSGFHDNPVTPEADDGTPTVDPTTKPAVRNYFHDGLRARESLEADEGDPVDSLDRPQTGLFDKNDVVRRREKKPSFPMRALSAKSRISMGPIMLGEVDPDTNPSTQKTYDKMYSSHSTFRK